MNFGWSQQYLMSPVPISVLGFYCCGETHNQEQQGKKGFILPYRVQFFMREYQGRNLEAGTKTEVLEECCLLFSSIWLLRLLFFFLNIIQYYLPGLGTTLCELNPPLSIIIKSSSNQLLKKDPTDFPTGMLMKAFFSTEVNFFWIFLGCVKSTKI